MRCACSCLHACHAHPLTRAALRAVQDLLRDLYSIPARAADRKVNEFVKRCAAHYTLCTLAAHMHDADCAAPLSACYRVRAARTHMILVGALRKQMPSLFGAEDKQAKLLARLDKDFEKCQLEYQLPRGDLPKVERYRQILAGFDIKKFPTLDRKSIDILDTVLSQDLPAIMRQFENPF